MGNQEPNCAHSLPKHSVNERSPGETTAGMERIFPCSFPELAEAHSNNKEAGDLGCEGPHLM